MMLSEKQKYELKRGIPTSFDIIYHDNIIAVSTGIRYSNQFIIEDHDGLYPIITLQYNPMSNPVVSAINDMRRNTNQWEQEIVYHSGTNSYTLQSTVAVEILWLSYYTSGVLTTWRKGDIPIDAVIITGSNTLLFQHITPDDNTWFSVCYTSDRYHAILGAQYSDNLIVKVTTKDVPYDSGNKKLSGVVVVNSIIEELRKYFKYTFSSTTMVCQNVTNVRNLDSLTNVEGLRVRQFSARIDHNVKVDIEDYDIQHEDITTEVETP